MRCDENVSDVDSSICKVTSCAVALILVIDKVDLLFTILEDGFLIFE